MRITLLVRASIQTSVIAASRTILFFASRRTIIKANFYGVLSKTTFFSVNEVSFSLSDCSFMNINNNYYFYVTLSWQYHVEFGGTF